MKHKYFTFHGMKGLLIEMEMKLQMISEWKFIAWKNVCSYCNETSSYSRNEFQ